MDEKPRSQQSLAGERGGLAKVPKGFSMMTPAQRSAAGRKGGQMSKRKKENQ